MVVLLISVIVGLGIFTVNWCLTLYRTYSFIFYGFATTYTLLGTEADIFKVTTLVFCILSALLFILLYYTDLKWLNKIREVIINAIDVDYVLLEKAYTYILYGYIVSVISAVIMAL